MKTRIVLLCLLFNASLACNLTPFKNQSHYELKIGEEVALYYTTNSCCPTCITKQNQLQQLDFIDNTLILQHGNCTGCSQTRAFNFRAISVGTDTLYLKNAMGGENCDTVSSNSDPIVINVSQG